MIAQVLLILLFGALCMFVGILIGSRNHTRIQADLDDAKSDINQLKDKVAALRAPLPKPVVQVGPVTPAQAAAAATSTKA